MKLFAVIGKSILQNRSPQAWNYAFQRQGFAAHYFRINPVDIEKAVRAIRGIPIDGCRVTAPFQHDIVKWLDDCDESAERLLAVNAVRNDGGRLIGFNTDFLAVPDALREQGVEPQGKRVVVLGGGGIAQAAAYGMVKAEALDVVLLNRNYERAISAAKRVDCRAVHFGGLKREIQRADILIACLPSNRKAIKPEWLHEDLLVFDTNCASAAVSFEDVQKAGGRIVSGEFWPLHQDVSVFKRFFGSSPLAEMKDALKNGGRTLASKHSIALIGFMGSGKTTVGKHLAGVSNKEFLDTDKLIEQKAGDTIPDIFEKYGEAKFREIEQSVFQELDFSSGKIISCGGGAVMNENTREILRKNSTVLWLWSPLESGLQRISKGTRPLFNVPNVEEKAKTLFAQRAPVYAQSADLMMVNEHISTRVLARKIYEEVSGLEKI
jgi:shikimate dehydrogenase